MTGAPGDRNVLFTRRAQGQTVESARAASIAWRAWVMAGLAMVMFIALFAFGSSYFGWEDPGGRVSLALFASFVFGVVSGYRVTR